MVRFFLIMVSIVIVLTLFLFPRTEPGEVLNAVNGETVASPRIVTLSPAFGYGTSNELFHFILSPRLSSFASSQPVMLVKPNVRMTLQGDVDSNWSFSLLHWFLVILLPSAVIAGFVAWKLKGKGGSP
jgi:hypothetical protein